MPPALLACYGPVWLSPPGKLLTQEPFLPTPPLCEGDLSSDDTAHTASTAAVEQGQAVALALTSEKVPDRPKGLPEPPAGTRYTVFVAHKQWAKVAEALAADPEDAAIIEGYAALDARVEVPPSTPPAPPLSACKQPSARRRHESFGRKDLMARL